MVHNGMGGGWKAGRKRLLHTIRRYPPATRMTLTSEKDFMMSLSVVVEKAWIVWEEFAGRDS